MNGLRRKRKQLLFDFLRSVELTQYGPNRPFLQYARKIETIKRNMRIHYKYNKVKYCIMNYQWSEVEYEEIKRKRNIAVITNDSKSYIPLTTKKIVPTAVRLFYIRECSKYLFRQYLKELEKWEEACADMRLVHIKEQAHINAIRALEGRELCRDLPDYPSKPYVHVFIPSHKLRDMVKEAMKNDKDWDVITTGNPRFEDLPILKTLKF